MLVQRNLIDRFQFETLEELRDFLNQFKETDLSVVFPAGADHFVLEWFEAPMSDGESVVNDCVIRTV